MCVEADLFFYLEVARRLRAFYLVCGCKLKRRGPQGAGYQREVCRRGFAGTVSLAWVRSVGTGARRRQETRLGPGTERQLVCWSGRVRVRCAVRLWVGLTVSGEDRSLFFVGWGKKENRGARGERVGESKKR